MTGNFRGRAVSIVSFLIVATTLAGFTQPRVSYAIDPNIPRVPTGVEGSSISQEIELGAAYLAGSGVARDEKRAAYWYEKAANSGDPAAQNEIGYLYQAGIGVERDPVRAVRWYERAVAGGLISAKVNLGVAYIWGLGVRKDPVFGAELFREAAQKGSGMGACYLGDMYYFGVGVTKSESEARRWFELASKLHNIPAKADLAMLLLSHPDQTSQKRAMRLLREASAAGSVAAKHQLGLKLIQRPELSHSSDEATKVLDEAASDGSWKSSAVLGILSREGKGVAKDPKEAYYHFRVAALQGREEAATLVANDIRLLSSELGKEQVQQVDQQANAWVQKHNRSLEFVNLHNDFAKGFPAIALGHPQPDDHAALLVAAPEANETP